MLTRIPERCDERLRRLVRWGAYPVLLGAMVAICTLALSEQWPYQMTSGLTVLGLVAVLMAQEFVFPYRDEWRMTKRSLVRDLKYITAGSVTVGLVHALLGAVALALAKKHPGPLAQAPMYVALPLALLTFEGLNYAHHRLSRELPGACGRFLWLTHVAHHLPDRVYVVMHAAFHPLNVVITQGIIMLLPLAWLGLTPEVTLAFNLLVGFHSIISHCNVDIRAGWLNYVLITTELHRFHHSADDTVLCCPSGTSLSVPSPIVLALFPHVSASPILLRILHRTSSGGSSVCLSLAGRRADAGRSHHHEHGRHAFETC
jgi:sterol desaturase/sphingolipid hydroxylase (fatty acid hydroxylase superfamily)